jgi:HSP20 family protein
MGLIPWRNKNPNETRDKDALPALMQLRHEMDKLLEGFAGSSWSFPEWDGPSWFSSAWMPSLDFNENDKELSVALEIPGVNPNDIDISLSGNTLVIQGEKKEENENKEKGYYRAERRFGSFRRTLELPQRVEEDSIRADYSNGVLTIKARKSESAQTKRIPVAVTRQ